MNGKKHSRRTEPQVKTGHKWVEVVGLYKKGKGRLEKRNITTFSTFLDPFRFRAFK